MCEFWDAGFQRPCSFRLCLLGVESWLPHERKLIGLIEGSKATQRRENLPQPTGWQAARYVSEAISALPVQWTHQLNCAPCENPGDKFTPATWPCSHPEGIHTPLWHAGVCEVVSPSHLQFFLRLFLLTACCIQRPYTSPLPSTQLGTPSMGATGGVTWHLGYVWGFQLPHDFSQSCCPLMVIKMV